MPRCAKISDKKLIHGLKVLVVDDRQEDRALLASFLSEKGYRVYMAVDGRDGYDKARLVRPDLILLDIHMPACDGLTACRLLKADATTRHIPVMFLTAAGLPQERVAGLAAGAVDYISKPFDFEEVRLRIGIHFRDWQTDPAKVESVLAPIVGASNLDGILYRATCKLLLQDLGHTPNLESLAQAVGTNTRRLNAAFRQCAGVTAFDFLREARMKEARMLILETSLDVKTIAERLGFANPRNFSTAFRERFGATPTALRQTLATDA